jgi:exopolysaccharide biosynthesis protein
MARAVSLALLLVLLCAGFVRAEWRIVSAERVDTGAAGIVHLVIKAEEQGSEDRVTLHLAVFSTKTATLRVIDDPDETRARLAETMQRERCLAGVNGGYFDPENAPLGLLISDGRQIAPLRKARLLSGVVSVIDGRVQIQRAAEFSPKSKPAAARQCGPFLVERSQPVRGLNDTRPARRTFVATSGAQRAALGYSSHVTLAQLARLLATPGVAGDLKIQRALNLDGGSSSAFWFSGEKGAFSIPEQKAVRDFLAIVPRS